MIHEEEFCRATAIVDKTRADFTRGMVVAEAYQRQPLPELRHDAGTPVYLWWGKRLPQNGILAAGAMFCREKADSDSIDAILLPKSVMDASTFEQLKQAAGKTLLLVEFVNAAGATVYVSAKDARIVSCGVAAFALAAGMEDKPRVVVETLCFVILGKVTIETRRS